MTLTPQQQKKLLIGLLAALVLLIAYRSVTGDSPKKTAPLTYTRGMAATSSVRTGVQSSAAAADPVQLFLVQRETRYPGVARDVFRMENPVAPKLKPKPVVVSAPTPTAPPPPPPPTPEEIAAAAAKADLAKFRFIGYLTETKDNSLFLQKDGEVYIVRSGGTVANRYRVKDAGKDFVVLADPATKVEMKVNLSGSGR